MSHPLSALFAVLGLVIQPITSWPDGSLDNVRLRLDADRSTYYLGEPVRLTLAVRNEGDQGVWGDFTIALRTDAADVHYRTAGGPFQPLGSRPPVPERETMDWKSVPMILQPGEERKIEAALGLAPGLGRFLLDRPGDYELKLVCRPRARLLPGLIIETNVVRFTIQAPPAAEEAAFGEYRKGELAILAQVPLAAQYYDPEVIRKAADFLTRHRHAVYAPHVRKGLLELLRHRMRTVTTDSTERQLYDDLRSADPEQH